MANLFGPEALKYQLSDSGARAVIINTENREKIFAIKNQLTELKYLIQINDPVEDGEHSWTILLQNDSDNYKTRITFSKNPSWIVYISENTGNPKGALHAHRALIGHLSGFELSHDFAQQLGDLSWTPADWTWIGDLANNFLCSWFHGIPVISF